MTHLRVWRKRRDKDSEFVGILLGISSSDEHSDLVVVTSSGDVTHVDVNNAVVEYPADELKPL